MVRSILINLEIGVFFFGFVGLELFYIIRVIHFVCTHGAAFAS